MYLWRNLPEGQLSAVLHWFYNRRPAVAPAAKAGETPPLTPESRGVEPPLPR